MRPSRLVLVLALGCGATTTGRASPLGDAAAPPPSGPAAEARDATTAPPIGTGTDASAAQGCANTLLGEFKRPGRGTIAVRAFAGPVPSVVYASGLAIDADGGRHAYRDDDKGLDTIKNACPQDQSKRCYGILERRPGDKVRQAPPNQAYYVSPTTLVDPDKAATDQARYVDSETINYLALPLKTLKKMAAAHDVPAIALGDLAFVRNTANGRTAFALFADVGPANKLGEGSIALAAALGIPSSPRRGGVTDGVEVIVFPGSGNGRPRSQAEIDREAAVRLDAWGGEARLSRCGAR